jgi:cytochrome c-type biogenesis protein CcmE
MMSLLGDSTSYANFNEAKANPNEEVHVAGTLVKTKPMDYKPEVDPNSFNFYMKDKLGNEQHVILKKSKPQDFERAEQLVIIGCMKGDDFIATDVLMKCPSKYNNAQQEAL